MRLFLLRRYVVSRGLTSVRYSPYVTSPRRHKTRTGEKDSVKREGNGPDVKRLPSPGRVSFSSSAAAGQRVGALTNRAPPGNGNRLVR
ncbi:hypothetical protein F2P81_005660 [Scophthalmus maximus]|uniref:Uncharacterized protein n=1 Tax=Scophthalmus maximus TaxID=52904 RepID=A0A6A4TCK1_SCOMX|nr:hypothetical protein F2P81_005660 [Scophthalmus maximus]